MASYCMVFNWIASAQKRNVGLSGDHKSWVDWWKEVELIELIREAAYSG
jgi:hypothetical protein